MKGDISAITQAVMLGVICAAIIVISLGLVLVLNLKSALGFGGGQIEHEFEIIGISNKPYSLAEGLTAYKPNDRSFLENSLEAAVAGSLPASNSQNIQAPVKQFLEFFGLKSYQVTMQKGQLSLLTVNNFVTPCGGGKGVCTSKGGKTANICGEGREQLADTSCTGSQVCCSVEIKGDVKKCGANLEGICTKPALVGAICGEGREAISSNGLCAGSEEQVCCKYIDVSEGVAGRAEVPLVYEGRLAGILRVETSIR